MSVWSAMMGEIRYFKFMNQTYTKGSFRGEYPKIELRILIPIEINGEKYTGLIDTGSTHTCISQKAWEDLKLEAVLPDIYIGTAFEYEPHSVAQGNIKFQDAMEFKNWPIVLLPYLNDGDADILIGMDILSKGNLSIDNFSGSTILRFEIN